MITTIFFAIAGVSLTSTGVVAIFIDFRMRRSMVVVELKVIDIEEDYSEETAKHTPVYEVLSGEHKGLTKLSFLGIDHKQHSIGDLVSGYLDTRTMRVFSSAQHTDFSYMKYWTLLIGLGSVLYVLFRLFSP